MSQLAAAGYIRGILTFSYSSYFILRLPAWVLDQAGVIYQFTFRNGPEIVPLGKRHIIKDLNTVVIFHSSFEHIPTAHRFIKVLHSKFTSSQIPVTPSIDSHFNKSFTVNDIRSDEQTSDIKSIM